MSCSKKKTPISGITTAKSEKQNKRTANRRWRKKVKDTLRKGVEILPELREVSNVWSFEKDGKSYFSKNSEWGKKASRK